MTWNDNDVVPLGRQAWHFSEPDHCFLRVQADHQDDRLTGMTLENRIEP